MTTYEQVSPLGPTLYEVFEASRELGERTAYWRGFVSGVATFLVVAIFGAVLGVVVEGVTHADAGLAVERSGGAGPDGLDVRVPLRR